MLDFAKVAVAKTEHGGSVELGMAADVIILPGAIGTSGFVAVEIGGAITVLNENGFRVGIFGFVRQLFSPLDDQYLRTRRGKLQRDRASADAGADDDDIRFAAGVSL